MQLVMNERYATRNRAFWTESLSGDKTVVINRDDLTLLAVIDGTGHGTEAHIASFAMADYLYGSRDWSNPSSLIEELHTSLAPTVGAAVGIAIIDHKQQNVTFSGVGNIAGYILGHQDISFVSQNGSVGVTVRRTNNETYPLVAGSIVLLHSDGIQSRFFTRYDHEFKKQSADEFMDYIFSNFGKEHDDASCIIYRY